MKKDIKLKTQFFLKKTYTYKSFRFFKKLNVSFFKNAFHFFHFFKFFSFSHFFKFITHKNIKICGSSTLFFKKPNLVFLKKNYHKNTFSSLHNTNYIVFDSCTISKNDLVYKNVFYGYTFFKKRFNIFNIKLNYQYYLILNNHLLFLTLKNVLGK